MKMRSCFQNRNNFAFSLKPTVCKTTGTTGKKNTEKSGDFCP
jgi:hypothetical protein